jgi:DNA-binding protein H-NS
MAKQNLASMPIDALLKMRSQIGAILERRGRALKKQLQSLGLGYAEAGRIAVDRKKKVRNAKGNGHALKGRKVAAKYLDPKTGETWSGRGATAGWVAAHEKQGRKRDQYLIARPAKRRKRKKTRS